ncbi:Starch-binding associating with outer membrane [Arenibacter nanhaiticus]|uniref:Starch-binding associating with outer membrane n=1 Tax=Arenibacter nanhaiticus TaxID=558155 RepID=A0A1M6BM13_9FLAO|nr:SusD/RagB family nutrient-binding outer membrane lipoprotein [Arenibacter nanhaiticus]SHI49697.1 Starch-binding associating with outer membrane [Arenibacter nanhaiticus]
MKNILKRSGLLLGASMLAFSCSDFEEINVDPTAATAEQVQVEYFINNSIGGAQQDPHIAERVFVLYWKDAGRMDRIGTLSEGFQSDSWTSDYYNGYVSAWLRNITTGIKIADDQIAAGNVKEYTNNLKQVARIWRVYIMSEMTDNFGPIPINGFQGENPEYNNVKDVYYYMLSELKEATAELDLTIVNPGGLSDLDPAYGYDYGKWKKYGNSLRMRLAMRLSEVDASKAQEEFEDAAKGEYISSLADNFKVQEVPGWNSYTGVMTREWNNQYLSTTLNNLMIGLGGVPSHDQLAADKHSSIKPANYIGLKYEDHFTSKTNDPSAGFWFDGLHNTMDPRAYDLYKIPGDFNDPNFNKYPSWSSAATTTQRPLIVGEQDNEENGETNDIQVEATNSWNAMVGGDWGAKGSNNRLAYPGTLPRLSHKYRNSEAQRIFFGSWESYFLLAEASVRGWDVPIGGKEAYEMGITESFEYSGVSQHLSAYLSSQDYNRAGTSVSWTHTAEPPATVTMNYINGYTGLPGTVEFKYPDNTIYKGGAVKNDLLTKIITQKFIAQTPWLPLETWSDHRRLGLPFFENPAVENPLPDLPALNASNFMTNSVKFYGQRLKFPSNFSNNVPDGYQQAVSQLGGPDEVLTPLWWAKQN